MQNSQDKLKKEQPSTYYAQDRQNEEELVRLTVQGKVITEAMEGLLSEQPDPDLFRRVLDVGCGPGEWVIAAAKMYPTMSLTGIDISQRMIEYAREQAAQQHVTDDVEFHVMDALRTLEFPASYFDLVNLRCAQGFMHTWDWPKMISELLRVCSPGGIVRVTNAEAGGSTNSSALAQFFELFQSSLFQAGNFFEQAPNGLTAHLAPLLKQHGCQRVQTKSYSVVYRAGTPEGEAYIEDMKRSFRTLRPFTQKWHSTIKNHDYDAICQQALNEMQQGNFYSTWNLLTAWGTK
jgi:ubiquinone/menaquinone biosynthesis C-methylase UbiE